MKKSPRGKRCHLQPPDPRGTKLNQNARRVVGLAGAENLEAVSLAAAKRETVKFGLPAFEALSMLWDPSVEGRAATPQPFNPESLERCWKGGSY